MTMNATDCEEFAKWLRVYLTRGVTARVFTELLTHFKSPEAILGASTREMSRHVGSPVAQALTEGPPQELLDQHLAWLDQPDNHLVTFAEPDYPQSLLLISDPPPVLFAKGQRALLSSAVSLAMVGSRNASVQGERDATAFAKSIAISGVTIVSGLALGIDAAAHEGALQAATEHALSGSTVAVIGTGLDRIYPARNGDLARRIAKQGLILSEFALGTPPLKENFPRRNRIISGLSKGVLVVEASLASGSLITARLAGEQGRDVFAIPGSIHSPMSKGCHSLIKAGAKLVDCADDVLSELNVQAKPVDALQNLTKRAPANKAEKVMNAETVPLGSGLQTAPVGSKLLQTLGTGSFTLDQLCDAMREPSHVILAEITTLELMGKVTQLSGGRFQQLF
jgi:DNA processing protein